MKRLISFLLLGFLIIAMSIAQETTPKSESEQTAEDPFQIPTGQFEGRFKNLHSINIGISCPYLFTTINPNTGSFAASNVYPGGALSIEYFNILNNNVLVGFGIQADFFQTLANRTLFSIPIYGKAGYAFILDDFLIPVSLDFGLAINLISDIVRPNFYLKPEIGLYYSFNYQWSFACALGWKTYFDNYNNSSENRISTGIELKISVVSHIK